MAGRAVLVTGGAGGVGRGLTEAFLERGAEAVICGRAIYTGALDFTAAQRRADQLLNGG